MRVLDVMTKGVRTCRPHDALSQVAGLMWHFDIGAVPVVDDSGRPVAMITDRDICMAAFMRNVAIDRLPVESAMSKHVVTIDPEETLDACEELMRWWRIRRIPVVDEAGALVGVVTLGDLAKELLHQHPPTPVPPLARTLASITERRLVEESSE